MKKGWLPAAALALALACSGIFTIPGRAASGITLTYVTNWISNPVGIDWLTDGTSDQLLFSFNYEFGLPNNFAVLDRTNGNVTTWGTQSGWNNEIYFVTIRPNQPGGWHVGDVFSAQGDAGGTGDASKIAQFAHDGSMINASFATMPGETKQKRGGIAIDEFGVAGYDMIVIASNDFVGGSGPSGPSDIYRITAAGAVTKIATVNVHLEGVTTVPNDPSMYGPLAGQILAGAEFENELWTIDPTTGATAHYGPTDFGLPGGENIRPEDLWIIPANSTFYGVEFGDVAHDNRIWKADMSQWTDKIGRILIAQEYFAQLYTLHWDPNANAGLGGFVTELIFKAADTTEPQHWEHTTFVPERSSIGDFVWNDQNANGLQDGGEPGIAGVTVQLYKCDQTFVAAKVTDANGAYSFVGLDPGCYYVTFSTPVGFVATTANAGGNDSSDSDAVNGTTGTYTLAPGDKNLTIDAGFYQPVQIGDLVWNDLNGNGQQDGGEPGIAGVSVTLYRCNGTIAGSTTTDGAGVYGFSNLAPGCYYVSVATPAGFAAAPANVGGAGADAIDSDAVNGTTGQYTVTSGANLTIDAGFYQPVAIGDFVWYDLNANGKQDAGEAGAPNATVQLYRCTNTLVATTTTNSSGIYSFTNLAPGCYYVKFTAPSGYGFTLANQGANDAIDSDVVGGTTGTYTLTAGPTNLTIDAGLVRVGQYSTFTIGGWGAPPNGNNIATLMYYRFSTLFPKGLTIGGGKTIKLTSPQAVTTYLPDGGTPGKLTTNYTNPITTVAGVFGAQVAALQLNVDFSNAGYLPKGLATLKVAAGYPLAGQTVAQVLATANAVLGGGALPSGQTVSSINNLLSAINANFDNGGNNNGVLVP
jgi:hypothetical protein